MGESDERARVKVKPGTRVWIPFMALPIASADGPTYWHEDDTTAAEIPDHPALPAVAQELARQGEGARTVTLSEHRWRAVLHHISYGRTTADAELYDEIRRQLAQQEAQG